MAADHASLIRDGSLMLASTRLRQYLIVPAMRADPKPDETLSAFLGQGTITSADPR
ncbi:hypothetical protein Thiowin_04068 [Thiorhodovibrio winogradskyi]|uniref:Uncharacterized protein n=1 Tax=Thiorhodovibrio winogradskyi TaxID=77007 RepID=A0ABZ0SD55_9GAMM